MAAPLTLSRLFVYPVKSLRGIALERSRVTGRGLAHDRRFMVVDTDGRFVTQRELRAMATICTALTERTLRLTAPEGKPLEVPLTPHEGQTRQVRVWRSVVAALDLGDASAAWLERALGRPLRLVYMPDSTRRAVSPQYGRPGELVGFADGYPYLVLGEASLADLNARLGAALPVERFRPNLVIEGAAPYAEDGWGEVHVGSLGFRLVKPCARCVITTLQHETGEVEGPSPLKGLAGYRRVDGEVMFGQNAIGHSDRGELRVGDRVEVRSHRTPPTFVPPSA